MRDRPKLVLVEGCGSRMITSHALANRPKVRAKIVPTDHAASGALDQKGVLSGNPLLLLQPLPDGTLSDADLTGERGLGNSLLAQVGLKVHERILGNLVGKVNSYLVADRTTPNQRAGMEAVDSQEIDDGVPAEVKKREGKALASLWKARRKRSQAAFANDYGFTQGNFSHYIGGRQPIPLHIGLAIAEELGAKLADFSPRLARELEAEKAREARLWPFTSLRPDALSGLTRGQLLAVESAMLRQLEEFAHSEPAAATARQGNKK
jgi:hypothetical protein